MGAGVPEGERDDLELSLAGRVSGGGGGQGRAPCVDDVDGLLQHLVELVRQVRQGPTLQDDAGQPLVGDAGKLDALHMLLEQRTRLLEVGQDGLGLLVTARIVERDRGVPGKTAQQVHIRPTERAHIVIGGIQHPDHGPPEQQWHAQDRPDLLPADGVVDRVGVVEAIVLEVVVGHVGPGGLGNQPAQTLTEAEPHVAELLGVDALGDPHIGLARVVVVEREVGDVTAEQRPGPPHDGLEDVVEVLEGGEVSDRLEQRAQLRLPPSVLLTQASHTQRQRVDAVGGVAVHLCRRPA